MNRRQLLGSSAVVLLALSSRSVRAAIVKGGLPWKPGSADPPAVVTPEGWKYFTPQEAAAVEAFVDRLIPPDPQTPGGKDCGCAVFIDRQLAGPHGRFDGLLHERPVSGRDQAAGASIAGHAGAALSQGAGRARCRLPRQEFGNRGFVDLSDAQKDAVIRGLEDGSLKLRWQRTAGISSGIILKDTQYGFLRRPDLWRQQGHGVVEDDWLSRRALRLSRLDRPS